MHNDYILFNDKKSSEFSAIIESVDIGQPAQVVIEDTVPFMNGVWDFSRISGQPIYGSRKISVVFAIIGNDENDVLKTKVEILRWLTSVESSDLRISFVEDYHFAHATCRAETSAFKLQGRRYAKFTVNFIAHPYMVSDDFSDCPFDEFNFATDCMNQSVISIAASPNTTKTLNVYSYADRPIRPRLSYKKISSSVGLAGFTKLKVNGEIISNNCYHETENEFDLDEFVLEPGRNTISLVGFGTLTIRLVEEVL